MHVKKVFFPRKHYRSDGDLQLKLNHQTMKSRNFANRQRLKQTSSRKQLSALGICIYDISICIIYVCGCVGGWVYTT